MHLVNAAVLERWSALDDEQVVAQILDGQTALFEVLMRRHNERLYRAARAVVREEAEAEDVMQQAYVNAYAHLRQFDRRARFATWMTRIVVNEAISRVRARGRYLSIDADPDGGVIPPPAVPSSMNPERQAFTREIGALLEAAVDTLPDGYREVFMLRDVEGLSTAETAECLSVSTDVIKTRLSRARGRLRRQLEERIGAAARHAFTFERPRCDVVVAMVMQRIS